MKKVFQNRKTYLSRVGVCSSAQQCPEPHQIAPFRSILVLQREEKFPLVLEDQTTPSKATQCGSEALRASRKGGGSLTFCSFPSFPPPPGLSPHLLKTSSSFFMLIYCPLSTSALYSCFQFYFIVSEEVYLYAKA